MPGHGDSNGSVQKLGWPPSLQGAGSVVGTTWGGTGGGSWGWGRRPARDPAEWSRGVSVGDDLLHGGARLAVQREMVDTGGVPSRGC